MGLISVQCRILDELGADVRGYNPAGLPMKDYVSEEHPKIRLTTSKVRCMCFLI